MMLDRSIDDPPTPPPSDPIQTERKLYPTTTSARREGWDGGASTRPRRALRWQVRPPRSSRWPATSVPERRLIAPHSLGARGALSSRRAVDGGCSRAASRWLSCEEGRRRGNPCEIGSALRRPGYNGRATAAAQRQGALGRRTRGPAADGDRTVRGG